MRCIRVSVRCATRPPSSPAPALHRSFSSESSRNSHLKNGGEVKKPIHHRIKEEAESVWSGAKLIAASYVNSRKLRSEAKHRDLTPVEHRLLRQSDTYIRTLGPLFVIWALPFTMPLLTIYVARYPHLLPLPLTPPILSNHRKSAMKRRDRLLFEVIRNARCLDKADPVPLESEDRAVLVALAAWFVLPPCWLLPASIVADKLRLHFSVLRMHDNELRGINITELRAEELREALEERGLRNGGEEELRAWLDADLCNDRDLMEFSVLQYAQSMDSQPQKILEK